MIVAPMSLHAMRTVKLNGKFREERNFEFAVSRKLLRQSQRAFPLRSSRFILIVLIAPTLYSVSECVASSVVSARVRKRQRKQSWHAIACTICATQIEWLRARLSRYFYNL